MPTDRKPRWRLESFDLRAGLVFTTFRAPQGDRTAVDEWPCFFIAPPTFAPEPVSSIAAALAAQHGSSEGLLLVDGVEAGFGSVEEVAAFVRRAYLASGGGDGADGAPGPDEPVPPLDNGPQGQGERPVAPRPGSTWVSLVHEFESISRITPQGSSFSFEWKPMAPGDAAELARAAVHLLLQVLLERAPRARGATTERWATDLWALVCMAHQRGFWDASHQDLLQQAATRGRSPGFEALPDAWWWQRALRRPVSPYEVLEALERGWLSPLDGLGRNGTTVEPVQALRRWPLPWPVAKGLPPDLGHRASLFHLLNAFCAAPAQFLRGPAAAEDCLALAIFAAACLLPSQSLPAARPALPMPPRGGFPHEAPRSGDEVNAGLASEWLRRQLPGRGFQVGLEERIARTMHQRYARAAGA